MTPNQVVAYNIKRIRKLRGWTQEEAAAQLEHHLGERWSNAVWSAAERSVGGTRVRHFDADELVALSKAFEVPITWWFLEPVDREPEVPPSIVERELTERAAIA